jgi:cytochrome c-type biogenesis protein
MPDVALVSQATAFGAGIVSFLSPCVLPLVPAYVSYVAGTHVPAEPRPPRDARIAAVVLSLFFVLGFSMVFIALGAGATALGGLLLQYRYEANIVAGLVVTVFGLIMLGAMNRVMWVHRDVRFHPRLASGTPLAALVLGLAFGFGWTPCIGPVLGAILTMSAAQSSISGGVTLLAAYALGLGVPFVLAALFTRELAQRLKSLRRIGQPVQRIAGALMVIMGLAMLFGELNTFSIWMLRLFPVLGTIG